MDTRVYVLTRSELSQAQRGVQGAHALAEMVFDYGQEPDVKNWVKKDKTLVFLQAKEEKCYQVVDKAIDDGIKATFFYDEYYPEDFGWTAVAFYPMTKEQGSQYFKGLKLA